MAQTTTSGQENKKKRRVSKAELEQSLAAAKDRVAKIEKDLKAAKRKEADHQKIVLGGWLLSLARQRPDVLTAALTSIHRTTGIEPPKELRNFLKLPESNHPGAA